MKREATSAESEAKRHQQEEIVVEGGDSGDTTDDVTSNMDWLPPCLKNIDAHFNSITYESEVPHLDEPLILGVDEAGRGPILGPMVYTVAYCKESYTSELKRYGFDDSKVLKHDFRLQLYKLIDEKNHELNNNIGYATTVLSAKDISSGMLKVHQGNYNLNEQAHDTTINLIRLLVNRKLNIKHVYVDTVGPPEKYQQKLSSIFSGYNIKFTVTKKADSLYPIVSCASIIAKVSRDLYLEYFNHSEKLLKNTKLGSGYPSDPNTSTWINQYIEPVFGWHFGILRYSWQTAKDCLVKNNAVTVDYEQEEIPKRFHLSLDSFGTKVNL